MVEISGYAVPAGDPGLPERFWSKVHVQSDGCWHWAGHINADGYGTFKAKMDGRWEKTAAHRWIFHVLIAPLWERRGEPGHLQVDHQCHNDDLHCFEGRQCLHRRCVNPAHLRATEPVANQRAALRRVERCPAGHLYPPFEQRNHERACKTCTRERRLQPSCKRGHLFDAANTLMLPDGRRWCRTCQQERRTSGTVKSA